MAPVPPRLPYPRLDRFIAELAAMSYWERRLFLWNRVKPRPSRFLYKFKSLDPKHADTVAHLRDLLVESSLWLSSPHDFNDPFDMTTHVIFEGSTDEIRRRFRTLIAEHSGSNWKKRRSRLEDFMSRPRSSWVQQGRHVFENLARQGGVFSFAGTARSILLWSHYAQKHTGLCLQFEPARDGAVLFEANHVDYDVHYPVFNWAHDTKSQLLGALLRKHKDWRYEAESRILRPFGAHTRLAFNAAALVGVILGCRMSPDARSVVDDLLRERYSAGLPKIRVYEAQLHPSQYRVLIRKA